MKLKNLINDYLKNLQVLGRSVYTIRDAKFVLRSFIRFLEEEKVFTITELTTEILEEYRQDIAFSLTAKGTPISLRTQSKRLGTVKGFTRYLKEQDYIISDPGKRIRLPKCPNTLPRVIMDEKDIKKILKAPDIRTNSGYRNRIILELLYDTAIRRLEIATIKLADLDLNGGYIHICGKGNKDRVVPVSKRVCDLLTSYTGLVRQSFVQGIDPGHLILNRWGNPMDPIGIWAIVKRCAVLANIKKNITTHTFRHYVESNIMGSKLKEHD